MRILLHCSGGPSLGVGHVMRSLALAELARSRGHRVLLAGQVEGDFLHRQVLAVGAELVAMTGDPGTRLARLVDELAPDVVHADTYDDAFQFPGGGVGRSGPLSSNLEDGAYGRRDADLVIDPGLGADREQRPLTAPPAMLRGSRFVPLRSSVTHLRGGWSPRPGERPRVLVVMGGADPTRMTGPVLDLLGRTGLPLDVTAVVPPEAAGPDSGAARDHPELEVRLVPPLVDLPGVVATQDLVVSAAGTSVWELCCIGVPMALVCTVDNQRPGYERLLAAGGALGLGSSGGDLLRPASVASLRDLLRDPAARRGLSRRASTVVDGLGAWRIVATWEQLVRSPTTRPVRDALQVRAATMSDARLLWEWRNDPLTRARSRQGDAVPYADHLAWLEHSLRREDRILLVAADAAGEVGTVRWDHLGEGEWEVSITVAPGRRGESLSRSLLAAGERELRRREVPQVRLVAAVHEENAASRRLFEAAGYLPDLPVDDRGIGVYARRPAPPAP